MESDLLDAPITEEADDEIAWSNKIEESNEINFYCASDI